MSVDRVYIVFQAKFPVDFDGDLAGVYTRLDLAENRVRELGEGAYIKTFRLDYVVRTHWEDDE